MRQKPLNIRQIVLDKHYLTDKICINPIYVVDLHSNRING